MADPVQSSPDEGRARPPAEPRPALPTRKVLGHEVPSWVESGSTYFITICVTQREARSLLVPDVANALIQSVAFLHHRGDWFARLFLVMPDHVHGLFSFPPNVIMARRVAAWKGYTAKSCHIDWQARFFDHRLRHDESQDEKAAYIRLNPVRAGLVRSVEDWPYVFDPFADRSLGGE